jgi:hypothetical protein
VSHYEDGSDNYADLATASALMGWLWRATTQIEGQAQLDVKACVFVFYLD